MSVTISADDPRTIRAIEIAADADQWLVYRNADGNEAFRVPSQSERGRYYLVTPSSCDCPDFTRRAASAVTPGDADDQHACKHMLAVRLHCELVRAQQHESRRTARRRRDHLRLVP
ncbi:MAG: SWIM zinc finger family protein [Chloroflexota bacterium]|nr:SWIM zinc finger family protein [Chloroflexota bacterium]